MTQKRISDSNFFPCLKATIIKQCQWRLVYLNYICRRWSHFLTNVTTYGPFRQNIQFSDIYILIIFTILDNPSLNNIYHINISCKSVNPRYFTPMKMLISRLVHVTRFWKVNHRVKRPKRWNNVKDFGNKKTKGLN